MSTSPSLLKPSKQQFLEAIAKIERFSPAARVLSQAMRLLKTDTADIEDIANLIRSDSALIADVLRGANSAYYGVGEKVSSLDRAIQKIGFNECIRLLKLAVAHSLSARDLDCYGLEAELFWAESLFNGLFLEVAAECTGAIDTDTAHTTGLLRYVGRLAINQCLHDFGVGLFWDRQMPISEWESENVGFSQSEAGAHLLRTWRFPEEIVSAIEWQSTPEQSPSPSQLLSCLAFVSKVLPEGFSALSIAKAVKAEEVSVPECEFVTQHNVTPEKLSEWLALAWDRFNDINSNLYGSAKS